MSMSHRVVAADVGPGLLSLEPPSFVLPPRTPDIFYVGNHNRLLTMSLQADTGKTKYNGKSKTRTTEVSC